MIYIRESHPGDRWWLGKGFLGRLVKIFNPNVSLDTYDPKTYRERRQVARRCESTLELGVRTCVDTLDDRVSRSYAAWPARIYLVGVDGKIVYRGRPGPSGFKPDELRKAIDEYLEETDSSGMTDPPACRLRETSKWLNVNY